MNSSNLGCSLYENYGPSSNFSEEVFLLSKRISDTADGTADNWRTRVRNWDPERQTLLVICFIVLGLFVFSTSGWISNARPSGPAWDAMGTWAGVLVTGVGFAWAVFTFKDGQRLRREREETDRLNHARAVAVVSTARSAQDDNPVTSSFHSVPKTWTTSFQWTVLNAGPFPVFQLVVLVPKLTVSGEITGKQEEFSMGNILPGGSAEGSSSQCIAREARIGDLDVVSFTFTDVWGTRWKGMPGHPVAHFSPDEEA